MKKLFVLRPINDNAPPWTSHGMSLYDVSLAFVIRADDETEARMMAADSAGDEKTAGANPWTDRLLTSCLELGADGPSEIIVQDFNAG